MLRGLSGSLLSREALRISIPQVLHGLLGEETLADARRRLREWHRETTATLGPTASVRTVFDRVAHPLVQVLGFDAAVHQRAGAAPYAVLSAANRDAAVLLVTAWGGDATVAWRDAVRHGIGHGVRWCLCVNGPALRIFDAVRVYSRRHAEFDFARTIAEDDTCAAFWGLLRAAAFAAPGGPLLDRAVELGEQHRAAVGDSLKSGVHEALARLVQAFVRARRRGTSAGAALDESLIVVYRILFLLFAEARDLVPQWHAIYRNAYTLESMRPAIEGRARPRGIWEGLQAIARLAHRGCRAGSLRVPAFNGRLFSPAEAPLADAVRLDDGAVRDALLVLTTRRSRNGRERIAYADLGVEQLGAVYEHVLDYRPDAGSDRADLRPTGRRKATGTFYTPRPLTEYLVRRTLAPLVRAATPEQILDLRVLDPSMGSGAFLVAACRHLAGAYEQALVREGVVSAADIGDADRTGFRRLVAQRCLFGVDLNPMAVQLGRLSLWLATLAADRPLTFLDHHLRSGNSLVGASLADIWRQPPGSGGRGRPAPTPLFPSHPLQPELQCVVGPRLALAEEPDDSLEVVRRKEMVLARLSGPAAPLQRWKAAADLWCAGWFAAPVDRRTFGALLQDVLSGTADLPAHLAAPLLARARAVAAERGFFHWTLEYPEAFYERTGILRERPGFDAVLGNPPWEMLRDDGGGAAEPAARMMRFARDSNVYRLQGSGHANLYQLFVERALSLVRPGGRLGFIVPSGLASDQGSAPLRRELISRTAIDTFMTIENRAGIFPIHRGLKFTLLTATPGRQTDAIPARSGVRDTDALERLPDDEVDGDAVALAPALLARVSGPGLAIPDIRSQADLSLVSRLVWSHPAVGDAEWGLRFGRELNATEDRLHFSTDPNGLPVIEGKHLHPFEVRVADTGMRVDPAIAARLLGGRRPFARARLAYRDVASATNRLTLIAAIVPQGVVTTHTVFVVRTPPDLDTQHFLCAIFNSYVANHLVRMRVSTHVGAAVIDRLPVPKPPRESAAFRGLASLSVALAAGEPVGAEQQALAARVYGLDAGEFARVLDGFTLVPIAERAAALAAFRYIVEKSPS